MQKKKKNFPPMSHPFDLTILFFSFCHSFPQSSDCVLAKVGEKWEFFNGGVMGSLCDRWYLRRIPFCL